MRGGSLIALWLAPSAEMKPFVRCIYILYLHRSLRLATRFGWHANLSLCLFLVVAFFRRFLSHCSLSYWLRGIATVVSCTNECIQPKCVFPHLNQRGEGDCLNQHHWRPGSGCWGLTALRKATCLVESLQCWCSEGERGKTEW